MSDDKEDGSVLGLIGGSLAASGAMVTVGVIAPTVVASGYGEEGAATAAVIALVYLIYRLCFGEDEAKDMLERQKEERTKKKPGAGKPKG